MFGAVEGGDAGRAFVYEGVGYVAERVGWVFGGVG